MHPSISVEFWRVQLRGLANCQRFLAPLSSHYGVSIAASMQFRFLAHFKSLRSKVEVDHDLQPLLRYFENVARWQGNTSFKLATHVLPCEYLDPLSSSLCAIMRCYDPDRGMLGPLTFWRALCCVTCDLPMQLMPSCIILYPKTQSAQMTFERIIQ